MGTRFLLTVDIEFSIAGAFTYPERHSPVGPQSVEGRLGADELGLGFLLETLSSCGARATFFVEVINVIHFGIEPMGRIAQRIHDAGHDVQLHIHPCWKTFERGPFKRERNSEPPNDLCEKLAVEDVVELLEIGKRTFEAWGLPRPSALRTGNFSISDNVYLAQRIAGIPLASNICTAARHPKSQSLQLLSGCHNIHDTLEVPALSYLDQGKSGQSLRQLQVTATSAIEAIRVIENAHNQGLRSIVAVTHAFEFFKRRGQDYMNIRPNRLNRRRLKSMCRYVSSNADRFDWTTFSDLASMDRSALIEPERQIPGMPMWRQFRMLENFLNDRIWVA